MRAIGLVCLVWAVQGLAYELEPFLPQGVKEPVFITRAPGDPGSLYLVEQKGRILRHDGTKLSVFLDIRPKVTFGGEQGLLSVAFHPSYAENHRFFVDYTGKVPTLHTLIEEYSSTTDEARELMRISQPYQNHNGGHLIFGPDKLLYIGMGDGGSAGDPHKNGQNKNSLLGKVLRIDIDRSQDGKPYGIPSDNPFLTDGRPEIFAYGLRNPWGIIFDRVTGLLYAADVGQNRFEEIDIIENGKNYGWNIMEGRACYKPPQGCKQTGLELPIHVYGRDQGVSVTGGFVYHGTKLPELNGWYVFGDWGSGRIWALHYNTETKKTDGHKLLLDTELPISAIAEDTAGEILVASLDGPIYRITGEN